MKWIGAGRMLKRSADAEEALRELCETRFLTWVVDQVRGARGQGESQGGVRREERGEEHGQGRTCLRGTDEVAGR